MKLGFPYSMTKFISLLCLLILALAGCHKPGQAPREGVSVGNGARPQEPEEGPQTITHYFKSFQFSVRYNKALRLQTVQSDESAESFFIDNMPLIEQNVLLLGSIPTSVLPVFGPLIPSVSKQPLVPSVSSSKLSTHIIELDRKHLPDYLSVTRVSVLKRKMRNIAELHDYAIQKHPEATFSKIGTAVVGATGLLAESRFSDPRVKRERLVAHYYFLTTNKDVISFEINAVDFLWGMTWVAPIVSTFTYDETPPNLEAIRIEKAGTPQTKVKVKEENELLLKLTDEFSGLIGATIKIYFDRVPDASGRMKHWPISLPIRESNRAPDLGPNWYRFKIFFDDSLPSGLYSASKIFVEDLARNTRQLSSEMQGKIQNPYYLESVRTGNTNQTHFGTLPVFQIEVDNPEEGDAEAPIMTSLRLFQHGKLANYIEAGQEAEIRMRISDKGYGMLNGSIRVDFGRGKEVSRSLNFYVEQTISPETLETTLSENGGEFVLKFVPPITLRDDDYYARLVQMTDGALNTTTYFGMPSPPTLFEFQQPHLGPLGRHLLTFHLTNKTPFVDDSPPDLLDLSFWVNGMRSNDVRSGDQLEVRFHAVDKGVGVVGGSAIFIFSPTFDSSEGTKVSAFSKILTTHIVGDPENNEFAIPVAIESTFLQGGERALTRISLCDKASNCLTLSCAGDGILENPGLMWPTYHAFDEAEGRFRMAYVPFDILRFNLVK